MKRQPHMRLTAELVASIQRLEPDPGPRPGLAQMGDDDYRQFTADLLRDAGPGPFRIFAYGSLIWKPETAFTSSQPAILNGWHRAFCMRIERWRGTREVPGLMMALDRGGRCRGLLFELPQDDAAGQLEKLLRREMTNKPPTNVPTLLPVQVGGTSLKALAFTANRQAYSYAGRLPLPEVAKILSEAAGHWGTGAEYLFNTVTHLAQAGITDSNLWSLQDLVAAEIERR
jgi:cation transport protein ChaC